MILSKPELIADITRNTVYTPVSGMVISLRKSLAKLSHSDLSNLKFIIGLKEKSREVDRSYLIHCWSGDPLRCLFLTTNNRWSVDKNKARVFGTLSEALSRWEFIKSRTALVSEKSEI